MPDAPQTAEEARALADRLDADAEKQEETLKATRRSAAAWRAYARAMEEGPLTSHNSYATDNGMSTAEIAKHPGPRATKGPMAVLAKELGLSSLAELAEALKETHGNVRSWNVRKTGAPERMTGKIAELRKAHQAAQPKRAKR